MYTKLDNKLTNIIKIYRLCLGMYTKLDNKLTNII